jgi:hypothetical protein
MTPTCHGCGVEVDRHIYCSPACAQAARRRAKRPRTRECKRCGVTFDITTGGNQRLCRPGCDGKPRKPEVDLSPIFDDPPAPTKPAPPAAKPPLPELKCPRCRRMFTPADRRQRYCSRDCKAPCDALVNPECTNAPDPTNGIRCRACVNLSVAWYNKYGWKIGDPRPADMSAESPPPRAPWEVPITGALPEFEEPLPTEEPE